jgi:hypothetical protein
MLEDKGHFVPGFEARVRTLLRERDENFTEGAREATSSRETFTDYHVKIGTKRLIGKVNPVILRQGVAYLQPFAKKDDVQANFSLLEFRNGSVVGGSAAVVKPASTAWINFDV